LPAKNRAGDREWRLEFSIGAQKRKKRATERGETKKGFLMKKKFWKKSAVPG